MRLDLEEWRYLCSNFYEVVPNMPKAKAGVSAEAKGSHNLLVTRMKNPAEMLLHDPAKRKTVCHDFLLFERFHEGCGKGEVGDIGFSVHPSRLHVIDMSRRYVSLKDPTVSEGVLIPHDMVSYDPSRDPAFVSVDLGSDAGALLATAHRLVAEHVWQDHPETEAYVGAFLDLVQRFMLRRAPTAQPDTIAPPLRAILREYVSAHLADPDLGVQKLSEVFGISRAALYRHFDEHGGVRRYIRDCRLDRCLFELAGEPAVRGKISVVARRWCFSDPTHFNRLFRDRFGVTPSECFRKGPTVVTRPTPLVTAETHGWVKHLSNSNLAT